MAFTYVTVTRNYDITDGTDPAGYLTVVPSSPMVNDGVTIAAVPVRVDLDVDGLISVDLAASNDPDTLPANAAYLVTERIVGQAIRQYYVVIPYDADPVDLGELDVLDAAPPTAQALAAHIADSDPHTGLPTTEDVRDLIGSTIVAGAGITKTVDDPGNTVTLAATGPVLNVRHYGALGDGATDDTTAIRAAITAAGTQGQVFFPAGTYVTQKLTLGTGVWLVGAGYEATKVKLKSSQNTNLIETTSFASLTGTDTSSTPYNFGIIGMTLDGNKAGNGSSGHCLAIYGYGYTLRDIRVKNGSEWGVWSEWGTLSISPGNDAMESFITDFKIHDCDTGGLRHKGPHDTQIHNGIIYSNCTGSGISLDIPTDGHSNGTVISMIHIWGGQYDYGLHLNCGAVIVADSQFEGALTAQILVEASQCMIKDCKLFDGSVATETVKGIVIANNANTLYATGIKCENQGGGVLDLTDSTGDHFIEMFASYYGGATPPSPAIIDTPDANSTIVLHHLNDLGVSTADSVLQFPGVLKTRYLGKSVRCYASSTGQTIASAALDRINLTTTQFNEDSSLYTVDLTADSITPQAAGQYLCAWEVKYSGGSSGNRYSSVNVNGFLVREAGTVGVALTTSGSAALRLAAGDAVTIKGYVDGGSSVTVASASSYETGLALTYMGP